MRVWRTQSCLEHMGMSRVPGTFILSPRRCASQPRVLHAASGGLVPPLHLPVQLAGLAHPQSGHHTPWVGSDWVPIPLHFEETTLHITPAGCRAGMKVGWPAGPLLLLNRNGAHVRVSRACSGDKRREPNMLSQASPGVSCLRIPKTWTPALRHWTLQVSEHALDE